MSNGQLGNVVRYLRKLAAPPARESSDQELLKRFAANREEAAFETLVRRHAALVRGVCRRVLRNEHDADDAFQATFLVLARKADAIHWQKSVGPWLHEVAHRLALKAKASSARRRVRETAAASARPTDTTDAMSWRDLQPVLDAELRKLPENLRAPLVLCYLEGLTRDEAAEQLGWTQGMVKGRLERGRDLLRGRLARRGISLAAVLSATLLTGPAAAAPPALIATTVQAGVPFAAGYAVTGLVSQHVLHLTQGVLHAMFASKLKFAATLLLAVGLIGTGVGVYTHQAHAGSTGPVVAQVAQVAQAAQGGPADQPTAGFVDDFLDNLRRDVEQRDRDARDRPPREGDRPARDGDRPDVEGQSPVKGTLKAAAPGKIVITLPAAGERRIVLDSTFEVLRDAVVTLNGQRIGFEDLKPGVRVTVNFSKEFRGTVAHIRAFTVRRDGEGDGEKPVRRDGDPNEKPVRRDGDPAEKPIKRDGDPNEKPVRRDGDPGEKPVKRDGDPNERPVRRDGDPGEKPVKRDGDGREKFEPRRDPGERERGPAHRDAGTLRGVVTAITAGQVRRERDRD